MKPIDIDEARAVVAEATSAIRCGDCQHDSIRRAVDALSEALSEIEMLRGKVAEVAEDLALADAWGNGGRQ